MADTTLGFQGDLGASQPEAAGIREQDGALLDGLRSGAETAYETLILRYEQPVYSIVSRLVDDVADAPDVVQEVFLKVFRKVGGFRGESSLKTWIYRIAVNEARNYRRWFGRHRRQEVEIEPTSDERQGVCDRVADPGPTPFEVAVDLETRALIEEGLEKISANYRVALVLREIEGLSYEEISEVLEISLGTVKSRILRGREALREYVAERLQAGKRSEWPMVFRSGNTGTA